MPVLRDLGVIGLDFCIGIRSCSSLGGLIKQSS